MRTRTFYDGRGRRVETRGSAPGGQDVVQFWQYDPLSGQLGFASVPYFVAAYTGDPGAAAYSLPDTNQVGTTTTYDVLGRVLTTTNALSQATTTSYGVVSLSLGAHGANTLEQTTVVDATHHQTATFTDAWGRLIVSQTFTGTSPSTYQPYQQTQTWYDLNGHVAQIIHPDGTSTTTYADDGLGRTTAMTDPDRGHETYAYDADGNLTQSVDARGASGTVYAGYDALDRQLWRNTTNSPTGASVTYTYDDTTNGNLGIGRRTSESFTGGPSGSWTGAYHTVYDPRGQVTGISETINGTPYTMGFSYDDAGHVTTQTYPDGEQVSTNYTAEGWMASLATTFPASINNGASVICACSACSRKSRARSGARSALMRSTASAQSARRGAGRAAQRSRASSTPFPIAHSACSFRLEWLRLIHDAPGLLVHDLRSCPAGQAHQSWLRRRGKHNPQKEGTVV